MFRAAFQNVDLFWVILLYFVLLPEAGGRSADADSCHEVKTAYMMRQIGPVELVPDRPGPGQSVNPFGTIIFSKLYLDLLKYYTLI